MPLTVDIHNLDRVLDKLDSKTLNKPLESFFKRAAIATQSEARERAPVDTGHLRNMIGYKLDDGLPPLWAKVGVDAPDGSPLWSKARAMEYGTGRLGDPEVSHKPGHFPPGPALDTWARRHGFGSGWQVAKIIARRGGLRPRRYLREGLRAARGAISRALDKLGADIKQAWER